MRLPGDLTQEPAIARPQRHRAPVDRPGLSKVDDGTAKRLGGAVGDSGDLGTLREHGSGLLDPTGDLIGDDAELLSFVAFHGPQ
ncbi:hypothetical protein [Actinomadura sp. 9N215]|uniref:hypothetical protein n=1 Tax=Actinomadura sp. 9N215 TaxID=3375150 RepID=UPI0037C16E78